MRYFQDACLAFPSSLKVDSKGQSMACSYKHSTQEVETDGKSNQAVRAIFSYHVNLGSDSYTHTQKNLKQEKTVQKVYSHFKNLGRAI